MVERGDVPLVGGVVQVQGVVENPADAADGALLGFFRRRRVVIQDLPRKLQQAVVPQHQRGYPQDVAENVLLIARGAQQDVQRVGQRDRHVRPEGLETLDHAGDVDLVLAGEAGHVHVEHRRAQETQLLRHLDGEIVIHAAKPAVRGEGYGDAQTRQGQILSGQDVHRNHLSARMRATCMAYPGNPSRRWYIGRSRPMAIAPGMASSFAPITARAS